METIERVAVLGAGVMGHGIAQVFAQAGYPVALYDIKQTVLDDALRKIELNLNAFVEMGIENYDTSEVVMSRIKTSINIEDAVKDAQFITEAAPEDINLKMDLLLAVERWTSPKTIIASNTSTLQITHLGKSMQMSDRLITTHWFNPPYLIPVVEVVKGDSTAEQVFRVTTELLKKIGKEPVHVLKETPGFLVNRIQTALFRETLALLEDGVASAEDIDKAVKGSFGLRLSILGPLTTADIGGLDIWYKGTKHLYPVLDCSKTPQNVISQKVENGHFGVKTGKGFFDYLTNSSKAQEIQARDIKLIELLKVLYPNKP